MRSMNYVWMFGSVGMLAAGCGDDTAPGLMVETSVANRTVAAGERIDARCAVLDPRGEPALDKHGDPLANSVALVITYQAKDRFATDGDGQVVAAHVGEATVRCSAPDLGLVDLDPEEIEIVAGPPVRVITQLASPVSSAGEPVGVTCLAFDVFDNPVTKFEQALALSPFGAGTTTTADAVTATLAGDYDVSCLVTGAAAVERDFLVVVPALPSSLVTTVVPERTAYTIDDQVTLVAEARDRFGNRVDDVALSYASTPGIPSPSEAAFRFARDGTFTLSATVTSPTFENSPLTASRTVVVNSAGPGIQCMRADAPQQPSEAYMLQRGPGTLVVPVRVSGAFAVQSVTINGASATLNPSSGNYEASVPIDFGMIFADVVAKDQFGRENSTTCFALAAQSFTAEDATMPGAIGMRLDPNAIGDPDPTGLNSINDILHTVLASAQLRTFVDNGLVAANPLRAGGCGFFACSPELDYHAGSIQWNPPSSALSLVPGGLKAQVTLPSVRLSADACSTVCCPGGSTIGVTVSSVGATVSFSLALQGGVLRAALAGTPSVTVGSVSLNSSGFCGFVIDVLQSLFTNTVRNAVQSALVKFINSNVAPLLDSLVSSLDITTLGTSFSVPRLDGSGSIGLNFGLAFSSFDITTARALVGIGTRFTPALAGQNRPSLGIPRRLANPLLDPPGTSGASPVGLSLYEGVLNEVLHGLWRGGLFQAALRVGSATATIDARLPPVAEISNGQVQMMLGGIQATIQIPGFIDAPIPLLFGGRATASVSLDPTTDVLSFGNLTLTQLFVSTQVSLTQNQRNALASLLIQILQSSFASALNKGLPAFPIPTFALPASAAMFGLPAGAELGILGPRLSTSGAHFVLTGAFGKRN